MHLRPRTATATANANANANPASHPRRQLAPTTHSQDANDAGKRYVAAGHPLLDPSNLRRDTLPVHKLPKLWPRKSPLSRYLDADDKHDTQTHFSCFRTTTHPPHSKLILLPSPKIINIEKIQNKLKYFFKIDTISINIINKVCTRFEKGKRKREVQSEREEDWR